MEETRPINENSNANEDNTPKVTGIGGIFFFSDNPETTRTWYANNLGLEVNAWGSSFESRDLNNPEQVNTLQWTPFKTGDAYFEPSKKEFMINYQVQNIEALIKQLEENGVTILDSLTSYDYGKFIHIMDADGNKIELWEPTKE
ncbi:MAG: VOC family protein [Chitinophagales bacterium]|nr:VOC family protein [Chitinophagales bacterium]